MYHYFFVHSSVDGHLACFHVLAIVNSAAMNNGIHVSFSILVFSPKNLQTINAEKNVEKREPSYTVGGMQTSIATMENSVEIPLKTGNRTDI